MIFQAHTLSILSSSSPVWNMWMKYGSPRVHTFCFVYFSFRLKHVDGVRLCHYIQLLFCLIHHPSERCGWSMTLPIHTLVLLQLLSERCGWSMKLLVHTLFVLSTSASVRKMWMKYGVASTHTFRFVYFSFRLKDVQKVWHSQYTHLLFCLLYLPSETRGQSMTLPVYTLVASFSLPHVWGCGWSRIFPVHKRA